MDDRGPNPASHPTHPAPSHPLAAAIPVDRMRRYNLTLDGRGRWRCSFIAGGRRIHRSTGTVLLAEALERCARWEQEAATAPRKRRRRRSGRATTTAAASRPARNACGQPAVPDAPSGSAAASGLHTAIQHAPGNDAPLPAPAVAGRAPAPSGDAAPTLAQGGGAGGLPQRLAFGLHRNAAGVWVCDFYLNGRRIRRAMGTHDLNEALELCARWRQGGLEALPPRRRPRHTCDDLLAIIDEELRCRRLKPTTHRLYHDRLKHFRTWYQQTHGRDPILAHIDQAVMRRYIAWRQETPITRNGRPQGERRPISPVTVNEILDVLRSIFGRAVKRGWMDRNPAADIPRDRRGYRPRVVPLSHAQLDAFFACLDRRCATPATRTSPLHLIPDFCRAVYACGLRRQEALMLTRDDIDLDRQVVRVRAKRIPVTYLLTWSEAQYDAFCRALAHGRRPRLPKLPEHLPLSDAAAGVWHPELKVFVAHTVIVWEPKGGGRDREVPIAPRALPMFQRLVATGLADWYPRAPHTRLRRELGLPEPVLLFPGAEGGPMRSNINREVNLAAKDAGLPGLRVHDLRHQFATDMRAAGVDIATIQSLIGHDDISTTQMYAHYTIEEGRRAVSHLWWSPPQAPPPAPHDRPDGSRPVA